MRISGVIRTVAAVTATGTLVMTAPAQARADDPMAGAPTVGTCTAMTPGHAGAPSDSSSVVPCTKPHTAQVAGVVRLPASLEWGSATNKALYRAIVNRCVPKVWKGLGRTYAVRDRTAYDWVWFVPTKAQRSQGARWLSCSVILPHGARLTDLPRRRTPMLPSGRIHDGIARCLTKAALRTPCAAPHRWRATGAFTVDRARRPPVKSLNRTATRMCLSRVDRHRFYRFTYSDVHVWKAGDHTVVCYTRTRR